MSEYTPPPHSDEEVSISRIPFTVDDERTIREMSGWIKAAGFIQIISGIVQILMLFKGPKNGSLIGGVIAIVVGNLLLEASKFFHLVATTDDADQEYTAQGFQKLRSVFLIQSILIIVALVFLGGLAILLFGLASAGKLSH